MTDTYALRLFPSDFGVVNSGNGEQLSEIVLAAASTTVELIWYYDDVLTLGHSPFAARSESPRFIGDSLTLARAAQQVGQFESGVFAAVLASVSSPRFRVGGLWTEDELDADLGEALIEIRAFDFSYWDIISRNAELIEAIKEICSRTSR